MRILFWQEVFWPLAGGIQAQAEGLLPALRERGHEIAIVTRQDAPNLPRADRWQDLALYRFPFWQALDGEHPRVVLALQDDVAQLCRDFEPDVVHLNGFGPTALFALQARRTYRCALVATVHSSNTLTAHRLTLLERTLMDADWVAACSGAMLDEVRRCIPAITGRSSAIYNGVQTPTAVPAPLPPASPRILCLGHLADHKGYDLVIRAAPALLARFPSLRVVIAGEGPARAALEQEAHKAGVVRAVGFAGFVERGMVADLINAATIVVVPSRRESFGLVAVEAALLQRPVVATRVGGLPEIVVHDETGLLVDPDDSTALADAIASLLANPNQAEEMGKRARERAERLFALGPQCDAYEEIYRRICHDRARHHGAAHSEASTSCE